MAFKEARETNIWLRLLRDAKLIQEEQIKYIIKESEEIRNILGKSVQTAKGKNKK